MAPLPPEDLRRLRRALSRSARAEAALSELLGELVDRGLASAVAAELGVSRQALHKRVKGKPRG